MSDEIQKVVNISDYAELRDKLAAKKTQMEEISENTNVVIDLDECCEYVLNTKNYDDSIKSLKRIRNGFLIGTSVHTIYDCILIINLIRNYDEMVSAKLLAILCVNTPIFLTTFFFASFLCLAQKELIKLKSEYIADQEKFGKERILQRHKLKNQQ